MNETAITLNLTLGEAKDIAIILGNLPTHTLAASLYMKVKTQVDAALASLENPTADLPLEPANA